MKKRFSLFLAAVLCLTLLLPASVLAEGESGAPKILRYDGSDYQLISEDIYTRPYHIGTAYIFAFKNGEAFYALGAELTPVELTLQDGVLSAPSGVAEVVPEPIEVTPESAGEGPVQKRTNFTAAVPAKIGDKYLTITKLNGSLALSEERSFLWHFGNWNFETPLAQFHGRNSEKNSTVYGCITFQDGNFSTNPNLTQDNFYIYQKVCLHPNREEHPAADAACLAMGNQTYFTCPDCGSVLNEAGEYLHEGGGGSYQYYESAFELLPTGHHYVNGVCTHDPSHIALEYERVTAGTDLFAEGYLYIVAAPEGGNKWKVMNIDPQNPEDRILGCTALMGRDGKLRIDNTDDGSRSAAEFRITDAEHDEMISGDLRRVPVGTQYGDAEWGMWVPDNGAKVCWLRTESGYMLMDFNWRFAEYTHHPEAILVREDGIAEIQMLTYTDLLPHYSYGTSKVWQPATGEEGELTCFSWDGNRGEGETPLAANVYLFRAKVPACPVHANIQSGAAAWTVVSAMEQEAVLSVVSYDADGKLTDCAISPVTLKAGLNQSTESIAVPDAASYAVYLLEKDSLRPLSVKRYEAEA